MATHISFEHQYQLPNSVFSELRESPGTTADVIASQPAPTEVEAQAHHTPELIVYIQFIAHVRNRVLY